MGRNLVDQPSKNEIEIACSFAHGSQWDFGKIPNGDSNNLWARRAKFFLHIFTILQRHAGQGAENEIEIALVSCTGSGSRAVQAGCRPKPKRHRGGDLALPLSGPRGCPWWNGCRCCDCISPNKHAASGEGFAPNNAACDGSLSRHITSVGA